MLGIFLPGFCTAVGILNERVLFFFFREPTTCCTWGCSQGCSKCSQGRTIVKILQEKEIRISRWGSYLGTGGSNKRLSFWSIWVVVLHRALPQEILHLFLDEGGSKPRPLCVIPLYHHLGLHWASAFSARTAGSRAVALLQSSDAQVGAWEPAFCSWV